MRFVRAAEAPSFTLPGFLFTGLTAPSRGSSEICTWFLDISANASSGEPHWLDHEEVFVLLSGTLRFVVDGEEATLTAGDAVAVPSQARLQLFNDADMPSRALVCVPAGMQAYNNEGAIGTPPWAQ